MYIVKLNAIEVRIGQFIAWEKHLLNRRANIRDRFNSSKDDALRHEANGVCSEMAVARALNIYPIIPDRPQKGGADLYTKSGATVDVKFTEYKTGRLVIGMQKEIDDADVYVLVDGGDYNEEDDVWEYRIVGWVSAVEAMVPENIKPPPGQTSGECYLIERDMLHPIDVF